MAERGLSKVFAGLTVLSAATFFGLMYHAIKSSYPEFKLEWSNSPCQDGKFVQSNINTFFMHIFLMSLAFGLFAPIGAVVFIVLRDMLGLRQKTAKAVHGFVQLGAFVASILGFVQMYYMHGANCGKIVHFQSVHSWVGLAILIIFWSQLPSALAVLSNEAVLPPGTMARKMYLKYHVFFGIFGVFGGLVTVILGILVKIGKVTPPATPESWYDMARAAMAAFFTLFFLALTHFEAKSAPLTTKLVATPSDPLLVSAE